MSSFNKVIVMGNLTRTPELRSTPGGTQVSDISVAVNEYYTDATGKKEERATFVDVTCWGKLAETVCRWKKQGDAVLIEGRLQQDKWVDKETGKNRTKLKVVAENVTFIGRAGGAGGEGGEGGGGGRQQGGGNRGGNDRGGNRGGAPRGGGNTGGNSGGGGGQEGGYDDYATSMPPQEGDPPF
ncbi:MAG: single-stranded DNA-binding protein [Planctomycetes bacterium]|nr:single-stranded DNA-binding protein [Planctomycetota bacterium]